MRRSLALFLALAFTASYGQERRVVGYYPNWVTYGRNFQPLDIRADRLDVINYAFANIGTDYRIKLSDSFADIEKRFPTESTTVSFKGLFNQLVLLKTRYPHLKTMISVADGATDFSNLAASSSRRQTFSQSVVSFLRTYRFDGVDIDWEFPVSSTGNPADKPNFTLLMLQLRQDLDTAAAQDGRPYLLTAAISGGPPEIDNLEVPALSSLVDWFNVMHYDYAGSWSPTTTHLAPLYGRTGPNSTEVWNIHASVNKLLNVGAPAAKLLMGVPFYAKGWSRVASTNNGLRQTATALSTGTIAAGTYLYKDVIQLRNNDPVNYPRYWDSNMISPWIYSTSRELGLFITYNDVSTVGIKADYVNTRQLGGMMIWELSGDSTQPQDSLLDEIDRRIVPHEWIDQCQVTSGTMLVGNLNSLRASDGNDLQIRPNWSVSRSSAPFEITVESTLRNPSPAILNLRVTGRTLAMTGTLSVEFWNWSQSRWDWVSAYPTTSSYQVYSFSRPSGTTYVEPGTARSRARLRVYPSTVSRSATTSLDQVVWTVTR